MRKLSLFAALTMTMLVIGCASLQTTAEKAVVSMTDAVEYARQTYIAFCNDHPGTVTEADFAKVKEFYVQYQAVVAVSESVILAARKNPDDDAVRKAAQAVASAGSDLIALVQLYLPPGESVKVKAKAAQIKPVPEAP